jgi:NADH:ubiquinone oxidoreductase subunit F (NADH-binding)
MHAGSMGRAVGALDIMRELRDALPDVEIVETGSDGAAWAAPVLSMPHAGPGRPPAAPARPSAAVDVAARLLDGAAEDEGLHDFFEPQTRRLLARAGHIDPDSFDEARAAGAYVGLKTALSLSPSQVVDIVEASGLRGRGGAYFPVHLKWRSAIDAAPRNGTPLLVVNAEEGEPGVFKDRGLMEADPHRLIEGVCIAAYAVGADLTFIYINGQAHLSAERIENALGQAEASGIVGDAAGLQVEIRRGAGGYVCGEETVILESIEGFRAVPRLRPPFPTESGLWGRPTVINNVETLCTLPDIFRFGVDWFREVGTSDAPGTKLISLSGALQRPGLVELPMGATVADILRVGGLPDPVSALVGVVAGGPSGGLLPPSRFDVPIGPGLIDEAGAVLGSGGFVAFDSSVPVAEIVRIEAEYNARESCGKCTPCREGGERLADALRRLRNDGEQSSARNDIDELIPLLRDGSLCGLGQMAVAPVTSALAHFADQLAAGEARA